MKRYRLRLIDMFIIFFALLAIYVYASPPSNPTLISPNNTVFQSHNVTLQCAGSIDPESNPITILFSKRIVSIQPMLRSGGTWSDDWWHNTNLSGDWDGDPGMILDMNPAGNKGWWGDAAGNANGLCERGNEENYYVDTAVTSWITHKVNCENLNGTSPEGWHLAVPNSQEENQLLSDLCTDANYCYIAGNLTDTNNIKWSFNASLNRTLQNTSSTNYNWGGLTSQEYVWNCKVCDSNNECTAQFVNNFSIEFMRLNLSFYDEFNWSLITGASVDVDLISYNNFSGFFNTSNGSMLIQNLGETEYDIRYSSLQHYERVYRVVLSGGGTKQYRLYMMPKNHENSINVTATVITTLNEKLEGAIINVMKYKLDNNSYVTMDRVTTNYEGKATFPATTDEFYRFIIEYPEGTTVYSTNPTYITNTDITFIVSIGEDGTSQYYQLYGINFNMSFNNNTNSFTYMWNDPSSNLTETCLRIYKQNIISGDLIINSSCTSSYLGSMTLYFVPVNDTTYIAKSFVTLGDDELLLGLLSHTYPKNDNPFGTMGLFIVFIATVALTMIGVWSLTVALIFAPMPLMFGSLMGIVAIPIPIATVVYIGFLILAAFVGKREG